MIYGLHYKKDTQLKEKTYKICLHLSNRCSDLQCITRRFGLYYIYPENEALLLYLSCKDKRFYNR